MTSRIEVHVPGEPVPQPRAKVQVLTRRDGSVVRSANGRVATHAYTPGKRIGPWKQVVALKLREVADVLECLNVPWSCRGCGGTAYRMDGEQVLCDDCARPADQPEGA